MKDGNIPDGLYGEVYKQSTGWNERIVGKPHQETTRWESEAIGAILLKEINEKYANNQHQG